MTRLENEHCYDSCRFSFRTTPVQVWNSKIRAIMGNLLCLTTVIISIALSYICVILVFVNPMMFKSKFYFKVSITLAFLVILDSCLGDNNVADSWPPCVGNPVQGTDGSCVASIYEEESLKSVPCLDLLEDCRAKRIAGECSNNAIYMFEKCQETCGLCRVLKQT